MRRIVAFSGSVLVAGVIVAPRPARPGARRSSRASTRGSGPARRPAGFGSLWVGVSGAGTLVRIDPATNAVTGKVRVGVGPCGVAIGAGSVWVDGYGTSSVIRVNPTRMKVPGGSRCATRSGTSSTAPAPSGRRAEPRLRRADQPEDEQGRAAHPHRGRPARRTCATAAARSGSGRSSAAASSGSTPARTASPACASGDAALGSPSRPPPSGSRTTAPTPSRGSTRRPARSSRRSMSARGPRTPRSLLTAPSSSLTSAADTVSRIDPATNTVIQTIPVGIKPFPAANAFGDIWVPSAGGTEVYRLHVG